MSDWTIPLLDKLQSYVCGSETEPAIRRPPERFIFSSNIVAEMEVTLTHCKRRQRCRPLLLMMCLLKTCTVYLGLFFIM
jgi:hypothetical protein